MLLQQYLLLYKCVEGNGFLGRGASIWHSYFSDEYGKLFHWFLNLQGFLIETSFLKLSIYQPKNQHFSETKYVLNRLLWDILKNKCSCKISIKKIVKLSAIGEALFLQYLLQMLNVCYSIIYIVSIALGWMM